MLFHKFLRGLLEAWGHKPKGTTVWELLKEVLQNLPFGVKKQLVEIVPEQSVTATAENGECASLENILDIPKEIISSTEKINVTINGKKYECVKSTNQYGTSFFGATIIEEEERLDFSEYPFYFAMFEYGDVDFGYWNFIWDADLGETITISISTEQEVVIPLDTKFVGGVEPTIFYVDTSTASGPTVNPTHEDGTPVTYEEAVSAGYNVLIYDTSRNYMCRPIWSGISENVCSHSFMNSSFNTVTVNSTGYDVYKMFNCIVRKSSGGVPT